MDACLADRPAGSVGSWTRRQGPTPAGSSRCRLASPSRSSWTKPRMRRRCCAIPTSVPTTSGWRPPRGPRTTPSTVGCATSCWRGPSASLTAGSGGAGSAPAGGLAGRGRPRAAVANASWRSSTGRRSSGPVVAKSHLASLGRPTLGRSRPWQQRLRPSTAPPHDVSFGNSRPPIRLRAFSDPELAGFPRMSCLRTRSGVLAGVDLDDEEHLRRARPRPLHGEEVGGEDAPGRAGTRSTSGRIAVGWAEAVAAQQRSDGRGRDPHPELGESALDPQASPSRVLPSHPEGARCSAQPGTAALGWTRTSCSACPTSR
jgi:hypothetical protein